MDSLLRSDNFAETALLFDKTTQDLGTITEDQDPISYRFSFRNEGSEPVTITRVTTTCGCTSAIVEAGGVSSGSSVENGGKLDTAVTVEAGAEGNVTMTFNPKNRLGTNDVRAFVYTSEHDGTETADGNLISSRLPVARLSLTGEVVETSPWSHYPFRMGPLRLMRNEVTLTLTGAAGKAVERILCANSGPRALTLSADGLPPYARFRTEPETIEPGEEADLVISIDMEAATEWNSNLRGFSFLVTGAVARPGPDEMIEVKIEKEN
ncbi:MAG: DUF1573 domain-containing protein [Bacteroidales bacterium]|nr:DUF1573 domain-containing protein [Bacteroidales bacterium]